MSTAVAGPLAGKPLFVVPAGPDTLAYWDDPGQTWRQVTYGGGSGGYLRWVPYTGPPQSFAAGDMTRDGDWTMIANKATTARPAPQPTGPETDLLPAWAPTTPSARATYTVYNEWTVNTGGWVDQYGTNILAPNLGMAHAITLSVNGTARDTFTATPVSAGMYWHDIAPIVVASGAVLRVTLQVTQPSGNPQVYWEQQTGLFATAPPLCSLAVGSKDGAAAGTTAYGTHLLFTPGTASPDWDIVAYGGAAAGDGQTGGPFLPLAGGTVTGNLTINANAAALPTPPLPTVSGNLHIGAADGYATGLLLDAYYAYGSDIQFRQARGTGAVPTATQQYDAIGTIAAFGHGATGYITSNPVAQLSINALQNFTDTAAGAVFTFTTMTPASLTLVNRAQLGPGFQVFDSGGAAPAGGDKGGGTINAATGIYVNNVAVTVSDERLKERIRPSTKNALAALCAIDLFDYHWKDGGRHDSAGFIAQRLPAEFQIPGTVTDDDPEPEPVGVDLLSVVGHLVRAVQQLSERLERGYRVEQEVSR
jgi:hypothetical protein